MNTPMKFGIHWYFSPQFPRKFCRETEMDAAQRNVYSAFLQTEWEECTLEKYRVAVFNAVFRM